MILTVPSRSTRRLFHLSIITFWTLLAPPISKKPKARESQHEINSAGDKISDCEHVTDGVANPFVVFRKRIGGDKQPRGLHAACEAPARNAREVS